MAVEKLFTEEDEQGEILNTMAVFASLDDTICFEINKQSN